MKTTSTEDSSNMSSKPFPTGVKPMLCTLIQEPFDDDRYIFEIKWDGYRVIAYKQGSRVSLESRNGLSLDKKYPSIRLALSQLARDAVLDGEVVVLNAEGKPDFDALQKFNGQKAGVFYYVFDLLWLDGEDITTLTLLERKARLKKLLIENEVLRYSEHFGSGKVLFAQVKKLGLEGIVAKKRDSHYIQDKRGKEWLKIPTSIKQEFVIGGWIESESGRLFRTLLFGVYEGTRLKWIGHAGSGYKAHEMKNILAKLKSLEIDHSPFSNAVDYDGIAHWIRPELVANIRYATTTRSGKIRKPAIFLGFRNDKDATEVSLEVPVKAKSGALSNATPTRRNAMPKRINRTLLTSSESNWSAVESQRITSQEELSFDDCTILVQNVDRVIWKGVTKAHLLAYYNEIAPFVLPHLKNRPLSLHLKLNGPTAPGLYIKDMEGREPSCADVYSTERKHRKPGKRDVIDYLVCNNKATLLYAINLGCIDLNPWTSTIASPLNPSYIVIDLDPSEDDFTKATHAALACQQFLDEFKINAFIKTSGKSGIHILIPCCELDFQQARQIAERICRCVHALVPDITTTELQVDLRGNRLYLDPNQNDYTDTIASAYSVRPWHQPLVSTPIEWKELKTLNDPAQFNIDTIRKRIQRRKDPMMRLYDRKVAVHNTPLLRKISD